MTTKAQREEQNEAIEELRKILKPGDALHTIQRHVSSSGMSRAISVVKVDKDGTIYRLDGLIARAGIFKWHRKFDGLEVGGAGMDMGFHVVYAVSRSLFPNGYKCSGHDGSKRAPRCNSNDHSNYRSWIEQGTWDREKGEWVGRIENPEPNFKKGMHHTDGGYALKQVWL
jgi:hypothetical protein